MPAKVRKNPDGTYRVETPEGTTARSTTKEKAEAQARLLNARGAGWTPPVRKKKK